MCSLDGEVAAVWLEYPRIARVSHTCDGCGAVIRPREPYLYHSHVHKGSAESQACCFACWWARTALMGAPDHDVTPTPDSLMESLSDCISGDRESPWRPLLAGIKARYRVSPAGRLALRKRWAS